MEQRAIFRRGLELREEQEKRIIRGYAVVFDEITDRVGYYHEKFDRNSFENADMSETVLIVGHDFNNILARVGVNMRIEIDDTGVFLEAELGDMEYDKLIYDRVKRRILDGMSIGFTIDKMETDFETKTDTIMRVGKVYELTLTPIPAYPQTVATAVERDAVHEKELREAEEAEQAKKKAEAEQAEADKIYSEIMEA